MELLPAQMQHVVDMRYMSHRTLLEIGRIMGLSRNRVYQIEVAALARMRREAARRRMTL